MDYKNLINRCNVKIPILISNKKYNICWSIIFFLPSASKLPTLQCLNKYTNYYNYLIIGFDINAIYISIAKG
jgi:hypothetical protein